MSTASLQPHRAGSTVQVEVNGKTTGRFVVDTGAAVVTLSESFAKRIGLVWDHAADSVDLVLANGDQVKGVGVVLDSVSVGPVSTQGVPAVVLKNVPDKGIDGLLGMSFLGRFQFSMEPGSGRLTFREFTPGE